LAHGAMPEVAEEALHVRTLAGSVWLTVPRADAENLRAADLRRRLCEVLVARVAPGISEGRLLLTIGARTVHEHDLFRAFWPEHGGDLDVQLTIRRTREDEVEQAVLTLLGQELPTSGGEESCKTAVDELASIELRSASELTSVVQAIYTRALADPSHCEYYADVILGLGGRYPDFPSETEGGRPVTFTRVLLNTAQEEFERPRDSLDDDDEKAAGQERRLHSADDRLEMKGQKDKMLANMKFIGNLFLRQLLAIKVVGQVVYDLVGIKQAPPEEHHIECVCHLLRTIGFRWDGTQHGKVIMSQFLARLQDLRRTKGPDGRILYSERIQIQIQDLLNLRSHGWQED